MQSAIYLACTNSEMERKHKIALSAPSVGEAELEAVNEVLREGYLGPNSRFTRAFDRDLEEYFGMGRNFLALN